MSDVKAKVEQDTEKDVTGAKEENDFVDLGALWPHKDSTKSKPMWSGKFRLEEVTGLYEMADLPLPKILYFNMFPVEDRKNKKQPVLRFSARKPEVVDDGIGDVPTGLGLGEGEEV